MAIRFSNNRAKNSGL
ncbi:MAG: hypothetical protein DMG16_27610 [Acidobacteria bacterium]|nr:MAG: hypothetical protein DMG12_27055 [Acidobacteriota bacterium]PYR96528.1 MAG: hypothetical protein DMG16_27610 [Acidobacteriota bacterium]